MCNFMSCVLLVRGELDSLYTFWMPPLSMVSKSHGNMLPSNTPIVYVGRKKAQDIRKKVPYPQEALKVKNKICSSQKLYVSFAFICCMNRNVVKHG